MRATTLKASVNSAILNKIRKHKKAVSIFEVLEKGHHYILQDELIQLLHHAIYENSHANVNEIILHKFSNKIPANILVRT